MADFNKNEDANKDKLHSEDVDVIVGAIRELGPGDQALIIPLVTRLLRLPEQAEN